MEVGVHVTSLCYLLILSDLAFVRLLCVMSCSFLSIFFIMARLGTGLRGEEVDFFRLA